MSLINWIKNTNGFTLLELMVITAIISLLIAISIPNYISYRNKAFCSQVETDAANVGAAISDYFGIPTHFDLPNISDLKIKVNNPVEISGDPNTTIIISVTDGAGRCPKNYQNAHSNWVAAENKYVKEIN